MERAAKRLHPRKSCRFTLVRDPSLTKLDSNTRKHHSQLKLLAFVTLLLYLHYITFKLLWHWLHGAVVECWSLTSELSLF